MTKLIIFSLFFPASLGLFWQIFNSPNLSSQLITIAFFLFCLEQARMAVEDLKLYHQAHILIPNDDRLTRFKVILIMTIAIELLGFYLASIYLGIGAIFVLLSQFIFNSLAGIKINFNSDIICKDSKINQRIPELLANFLCLLLILFWMLNLYPLIIAIVIISVIIIYGIVKLTDLWHNEVNQNFQVSIKNKFNLI